MTPTFNPPLNHNDRFIYCPFPKHKNIKWTIVVQDDLKYVEFLVSDEVSVEIDDAMYEFLVNLLEDYYNGELDV